jgi:hypothetical protein
LDASRVRTRKSSGEGFRDKEERRSGGPLELRTSKIVFSLLGSTLQGLDDARWTRYVRSAENPTKYWPCK